VVFVPGDNRASTGARALRVVAVRAERRQEVLFADGSAVTAFVGAPNPEDWAALRLIERHREKGATIEHVHHVWNPSLSCPC
jgi:hypothetical protein